MSNVLVHVMCYAKRIKYVVCVVLYMLRMLLHVVAYDMLCYVTYDGKSCYVVIRQTRLCCVLLLLTVNHVRL